MKYNAQQHCYYFKNLICTLSKIILTHKIFQMKKTIFLLIFAMTLMSCNQESKSNAEYEANNAIFLKNVETFKNHFLKGFETKNLDLMMEMYADSLVWDGPNAGGVKFNKEDLSKTLTNYLENFNDIKLNNQLYFGGSVYASPMKPFSNPNYIRVVGKWTNTHIESGVPTSLKWHAVMWFDNDGKVYRGTDWMDVSSLESQITNGLDSK